MVPESGARVYAAWDDWLLTPGGNDLASWVLSRLDTMLADEFGYFAMQCGLPGLKGLRNNRMSHRIHLAIGLPPPQTIGTEGALPSLSGENEPLAAQEESNLSPPSDQEQDVSRIPIRDDVEQVPAEQWVAADAYDSLPVASSSIDLLVLPFVLEFSSDPHAVLREAHRVLRNEGRVVIAGLNPWSLWGLQELGLSAVLGSCLPVEPRMIALGRLRDWLRLLEFDIDRGRFGCYKPLCTTQAWLDRWSWIEDAGDRWWPICGAAYLIGAVKRVQGMRLVGLAARSRQNAFARPQVAGAR
jgi:SAM-dependent methyltransferase